jgi:hypothetical protein
VQRLADRLPEGFSGACLDLSNQPFSISRQLRKGGQEYGLAYAAQAVEDYRLRIPTMPNAIERDLPGFPLQIAADQCSRRTTRTRRIGITSSVHPQSISFYWSL